MSRGVLVQITVEQLDKQRCRSSLAWCHGRWRITFVGLLKLSLTNFFSQSVDEFRGKIDIG